MLNIMSLWIQPFVLGRKPVVTTYSIIGVSLQKQVFDIVCLPITLIMNVGNSSVEYQVEMYNEQDELLVDGKFVHVYVTKAGKPHRIPEVSRALLNSIGIASET
jgi:acyl-CoA hydrolase